MAEMTEIWEASAERGDLSINSAQVLQIKFDQAVTLVLDRPVEIRLESPFHYDKERETLAAVTPGQLDGARAVAVLSLLYLVIERAIVSRGGELRLYFDDGRVLVAAAHPDFEAWSIVARSGEQLIVNPGGELSHFPRS